MPECELVHQSERRTAKDRNLAAGLQRTTSAQFVELLAARRVCQDSGDDGMRKASTRLLEQGIQAPSPAPDLIPAETKTSTENLHWDWYSKRGHFRTIYGESDRRLDQAACAASVVSKWTPLDVISGCFILKCSID